MVKVSLLKEDDRITFEQSLAIFVYHNAIHIALKPTEKNNVFSSGKMFIEFEIGESYLITAIFHKDGSVEQTYSGNGKIIMINSFDEIKKSFHSWYTKHPDYYCKFISPFEDL